MKKTLEQLPGWEFDIEEVSAGVYRAIGRNGRGGQLSFTGEDPEVLLRQCISAAMANRAPNDKRSRGND